MIDSTSDPTITPSPFFIIGAHRSGTTLLRYMLNSSPRIYIPPESDFIPYFFQRKPTEPLTPERIAKILRIIFTRYRFVREWSGEQPDAESFRRQMDSSTPAGFLNTLYQLYMRQNKAVVWGDKTPIYSSYVDLLARIFPNAKFVHLIRDGRDVAQSMVDKWGKKEFHIDIYFAIESWRRRTIQAQKAGIRLGAKQYYELRYENLVTNPEQELKSLCNFLGEPYFSEMAQPQQRARQDIPPDGFHAPIRQPPSPHRIARWQNDMSPQNQRLCQKVAASLLTKLGYPLAELGRMTPAETSRYWTLAAKYTVLQSGRQTLQTFGVLPPI